MSIEYTKGTFGPTLPVNEILEKLEEAFEAGISVYAAHFGTAAEIETRKKLPLLEDRIKALEEKAGATLTSDCLHLPTIEEIKILLKEPS